MMIPFEQITRSGPDQVQAVDLTAKLPNMRRPDGLDELFEWKIMPRGALAGRFTLASDTLARQEFFESLARMIRLQ